MHRSSETRARTRVHKQAAFVGRAAPIRSVTESCGTTPTMDYSRYDTLRSLCYEPWKRALNDVNSSVRLPVVYEPKRAFSELLLPASARCLVPPSVFQARKDTLHLGWGG